MPSIQNSSALSSSIDMNLVEYDETQNPFADAFCAPMIRWDVISSAYNASSGKTRVWDRFAGTAFEMKAGIISYLTSALWVFHDHKIPTHCYSIILLHGINDFDSNGILIGRGAPTILAILLEHHENGLI